MRLILSKQDRIAAAGDRGSESDELDLDPATLDGDSWSHLDRVAS
jgi:hypothetical protein